MLARYLGNEPDSATPRPKVEKAPQKGGFADGQQFDSWVVSADRMSSETSFWDVSVWPPKLTRTLAEFAFGLNRSRDGRWVLFSDAHDEIFRPRVFSDHGKRPIDVFPVKVEGAELSIYAGGFIGDRLVVFKGQSKEDKPFDLPSPLWLEGKAWRPMPGLQDVQYPRGLYGSGPIGIVQLRDGHDVAVCGKHGYELRAGQFAKTFSMEASSSHVRDWTYSLAGLDGFYYLSNRHLFEIHRGSTPVPHASRWGNIMHIQPGPAGSMLLREGDNDDGDMAKLYLPSDETFIHIEPELFGIDSHHAPIFWSEKADRFVVSWKQLLAVRTALVLALPRYRVRTGRKVKS
jgi:hypothetical protein